MDKLELQKLLLAYKENRLTEEEAGRLITFVNTKEGAFLLEQVWDEDFTIENQEGINVDLNEPLKIFSRKIEDANDKQYKRKILTVAASLTVFFALSFFIFKKSQHIDVNQNVSYIIKPGEDKAIITLEDGQQIDLDAHLGDTIYANSDFSIYVGENGVVEYLFNKEENNVLTYRPNKIRTPKGGSYRLLLPDGSKVWLNSDSELTYPIQFDADSREVHLQGEAFFEISNVFYQNEKVPFFVKVGEHQVTVLGTSFNINSYKDAFSTTLVTGRVMLENHFSKEKTILHPNQAATFDTSTGKFKTTAVDPYYSVAWKEGKFAFDGASIYDVMDQVSRWYDIDVEYAEPLKDVFFSGSMSKGMDIKELLNIIEWTESIKFEIKERRIIVRR